MSSLSNYKKKSSGTYAFPLFLCKNFHATNLYPPTGSLDSENAMQIIDILRGIADSGKTVVMVTHDMEAVAKCDRLIRLHRGEVVPE